MMAAPAGALNIGMRALVEADDGAAAQVIPDSMVGASNDAEAIAELVRGADVLTFEHEHVPTPILTALEDAGVAVQPGSAPLRCAQDKIHMRRELQRLGSPCPRWAQVTSVAQLQSFGDDVGWPVVLKRPVGGYDGKGVRVIDTAADGEDWVSLDGGALVEEKVPFTSEIAVLLARRPSGQMRTWAPVQTTQVGGVCSEVISPAPELDNDQARAAIGIAETIAAGLGVTGVLAVEMFRTEGGELLVNELAMRPHNSGHITIDAHTTSQFEQHLRAVLNLPLGDTAQHAPWAVMVNVLGSTHDDPTTVYPELMERYPGAKAHMYGKGVRPGRKLGHVNVMGDDLQVLRRQAREAADLLEGR